MIRDRRHAAASLAVAFMLATSCLAIAGDPQKRELEPYALLFGTLYGPDQRPAYGVKIKIRRADQKKAKWELYSNHQGEFAQRVPAGKADYIITADVKGNPKPELTVHVDNDERKDFVLHMKGSEKHSN
ncbi:MAG TPA: hypothetical protein VNX88_24160 [Terriglobales bacterium]|nr:hypothetical protein [Terriglobales bacterium]